MLKGQVFSKQVFNSEIFALFINTFTNGKNGVSNNFLNGMALSYSGSNITVASGAVCIQGRFLKEDTGYTISAGTDNLYCKLVIEIDLDKENTESQFNQANYKIVKSTNNYPSLTQTNIVKNNAGIYQYELARFKTSVNGITDFQDMRTFLDFESIYDAIESEYNSLLQQLQEELNNVEDGSAYFLKATQLTNQDLNSINTEGYYYASGGNTCANKPSDINDFGLYVKRIAGGKYKQILDFNDVTYTRYYSNSIWTPWIKTITKGDFAIITGKVTDNAGIINLPQGFNADNSTIISLLLNPSIKPENWGYGSTMDSASNLSGCFPVRVYLRGENAVITVKDIKIIENQTPTIGTTPDVNFRLVLMKI